MTMTGPQIERMAGAIRRAYSRDELRRVLRVCMEEEFDDLVADRAFTTQVFELVTWAVRQDRVIDLLRCAYEHNPTNDAMRLLWLEFTPETSDGAPKEGTPCDIFLSFSHHDLALAKQLLADLETAGFSVWTDGHLAPGTPNWQDAIEAAAEKCKCMVVVMTPHAKVSRWVRTEVDLAQDLKRPVVPLLADGERKDAVLFSLRDVQYLDSRRDYADVVRTRLIPTLLDLLGKRSSGQPVPHNDTAATKLEVSAPEPVAPPVPESPKTATLEVGLYQPPTIFCTPPLEIEWVTIPRGEFLMGSDRSKDTQTRPNETPQHSVSLPTYHISKYPITNAQYLEFVKASGHKPPDYWPNGKIPQLKDSHPVVNVSWHDACAFCEWASTLTKCTIRLPSEAEWEKAARGPDGRIWPWGNKPPTKGLCNFARNEGGTTPVGKYPEGKSPYGVFDMAGNVWEWTNSKYRPYKYDPDDGRENAEGDAARTLRGGSWGSIVNYVRCADRFDDRPNYWTNIIGFRVLSPAFEVDDLWHPSL